jgi:hypothetical protein
MVVQAPWRGVVNPGVAGPSTRVESWAAARTLERREGVADHVLDHAVEMGLALREEDPRGVPELRLRPKPARGVGDGYDERGARVWRSCVDSRSAAGVVSEPIFW